MKKEFLVNWDNPKDLTRLISQLHNRKRELEGHVGKKQKAKDRLALMLEMWNSPISLSGEDLSIEKDFYIYIHYLPDRKVFPCEKDSLSLFCHAIGLPAIPFYVGKGKGSRHSCKERNKGHQLVRKLSEDRGNDTQSFVLLDGLTEIESLLLEGKLIDIIGQRAIKTGPLTNLDEGYKVRYRRRQYSLLLGKVHPVFYKPMLGDQRSSHMT
jgi:hypothetical protein